MSNTKEDKEEMKTLVLLKERTWRCAFAFWAACLFSFSLPILSLALLCFWSVTSWDLVIWCNQSLNFVLSCGYAQLSNSVFLCQLCQLCQLVMLCESGFCKLVLLSRSGQCCRHHYCGHLFLIICQCQLYLYYLASCQCLLFASFTKWICWCWLYLYMQMCYWPWFVPAFHCCNFLACITVTFKNKVKSRITKIKGNEKHFAGMSGV